MAKFTFNIPDKIYEVLREKSFKEKVPMTMIILDGLSKVLIAGMKAPEKKDFKMEYPPENFADNTAKPPKKNKIAEAVREITKPTLVLAEKSGLVKQRGEINAEDYV